jgi:hypothetical protein
MAMLSRISLSKTLAAAALLALGSPLAASAQEPDATVSMSGGHVGLGLGYSWGKGVLHYRGKDYPFHLVGLAAGDIGASNFKAEGAVYNLARAADFEGKFDTLNAGASIAVGGAAAVEENTKGVQIRLNAKAEGLHVSFGIGGMRTTFDAPARE